MWKSFMREASGWFAKVDISGLSFFHGFYAVCWMDRDSVPEQEEEKKQLNPRLYVKWLVKQM